MCTDIYQGRKATFVLCRLSKMWCHDSQVWRFVFARYLPALAVLSALWEAPPTSIAYAVFHCTVGDVLIGVGALLAALIATRASALHNWHWILVNTVAVIFGFVFTAFSEWFNTTVLASWTYSEWMPLTPFVPIGVSPLLQWVVVPLAALAFSRRVAYSSKSC